MELIIKSFEELSLDELYDILKLRSQVFILEQDAPCEEIDGRDKAAIHVFMWDQEGIQAYLRVLGPGVIFPEPSIGRVIAVKRRQGLGTAITREGMRVARERFGAESIRIEAQTYAKSLYEKLGFQQVSEEFLEHGIPHVQMIFYFA